MNIFTTDAFLETAGALFFPQRMRRIEVCRVEGRRLRVLVLDDHELATDMPYYDFPQPLENAQGPADRELLYFPRTVVRTTLIEERKKETEGFRPSPYIDWKKLPTWEAYEARWKASPVAKSYDAARQRRRLEKEFGPLSFRLDDGRPEVFESCLRWKSSQYLSTGLPDMFADPRNVALFRRLRERGVLVVSSLCAGDTLLAVHFGSLHDGRFGWWVPAYDPAYSKFSPGGLLLEELLKASHARGDVEFDFLIGGEGYKFLYATHNRVIGPVGTPPLSRLILSTAKKQAKALLEKNPRALELARTLQKRLGL